MNHTNRVHGSPRKHVMSVLQITRWCISLYCRCCPDFKAPRGMVQLSELLPLELEQHRRWTNAGPCRGPHSQCASSRPTHGSLPQPEGVVQPIVHHGQRWQLFDNCLCGWSAYTHPEADGRRVSGEFSEVAVFLHCLLSHLLVLYPSGRTVGVGCVCIAYLVLLIVFGNYGDLFLQTFPMGHCAWYP